MNERVMCDDCVDRAVNSKTISYLSMLTTFPVPRSVPLRLAVPFPLPVPGPFTVERRTPVKPLWLSGPFDRSNGLCECRIAALMPAGLAWLLSRRLDSAASSSRQHDDLRIDADQPRA